MERTRHFSVRTFGDVTEALPFLAFLSCYKSLVAFHRVCKIGWWIFSPFVGLHNELEDELSHFFVSVCQCMAAETNRTPFLLSLLRAPHFLLCLFLAFSQFSPFRTRLPFIDPVGATREHFWRFAICKSSTTLPSFCILGPFLPVHRLFIT